MAAGISTKRTSLWVAIAIAAGVGIAAMPEPAGLSHIGQSVLAITAFTAILWASQVINNGISSVLMMALLIAAGVKPPLALSGFSAPPFWVLLTVLFYGFAMKKTGLAQRISYYILSLFPSTYWGILSAFFAIGFVLALGIPSMTVRTAIMIPIAWALVQSLGIPPRSRGSALIILTAVEMAVIPGLAFLYGALSGPIVESAFQAKHLPLTWLSYARYLTFPTLLLCALILVANQIVLRPDNAIDASPEFARERLRGLGPFRHPELITGLVVLCSIVFWTTDRYHHLPSFFAGMIAMVVFALTGILRDEDIGTGVSWPLLLYLGGIFGLANIIQEYKITNWLAAYLVPIAHGLISNTVVLLLVVAVSMFVLRFLDPSSFIAISVLFLSVVDVTSAVGIPPLVLMSAVLLSSVPFWMTYQNFWIAMSESLTSAEAFTNAQLIRIASTYAMAVLLTLICSTAYWKLIGAL
jgi:anion transporter